MSLECLLLEESQLLLLDPDACSIVVEELLVDEVTAPLAEEVLFVDELAGTFSDVATGIGVFPFACDLRNASASEFDFLDAFIVSRYLVRVEKRGF